MASMVEDVIFKNPQVTEKLEQMFNNERCTDTVFLVNEARFKASSHLITVSNAKLDAIVDTHYQNCKDREIRIGPVKYNESFQVLLKYMYGVPINFTQMNKAVMCEVLSLCEEYEFSEFSKEIKGYFSKFDSIDVDSVVELLNTCKKYNLKELHEKCTVFAYKNADQLVKHASFVDLQYHVLFDLIKSDWFCTKEVDILRRTLNWHSNNLSGNVLEGSECDDPIDVSESVEESQQEDEKNNEVSLTESSNEAINIQHVIETQDGNKSSELVKIFSKNILKVLLSHIRINRIPAMTLLGFCKSEEGQVYQEYLSDVKNFPKADKERKAFTGELVCSGEAMENIENYQILADDLDANQKLNTNEEEVQNGEVDNEVIENLEEDNPEDFTLEERDPSTSNQNQAPLILSLDQPKEMIFTIDVKYGHSKHKSNECFSFEGFNFKLIVEYVKNTKRLRMNGSYSYNNLFLLKVFLQCTSDIPKNWNCATSLDIMSSESSWTNGPRENLSRYKNVELNAKNNHVLVGEMPWWDMVTSMNYGMMIYRFEVFVIFNQIQFEIC